MGRPPSTDRKEVVTLRLRQSVIDAYRTSGEDWRARMEAAIEAALQKAAEPVPKAKAATPAPRVRKAVAEPQEAAERPKIVNRLKGQWKAP